MKTTKSGIAIAVLAAIRFATPPTEAADGTWDGGGSQPVGQAIWGGNNNWNPNGAVASGTDSTATFGSAFNNGYRVIVNTARIIGHIVFNDPADANDLTLAEHPSLYVLTLDVSAGQPTINVSQAGRTLIVEPRIGGSDGLAKMGPGMLALNGANLFTGPTLIQEGTLLLSNVLALQNSVLDTANSVAGDANSGLKTTVVGITLGGLTGNKDFASVFTTAAGGYDTVTGLTLNPGSAVVASYSGAIADGASGMNLTKTGPGIQVLAGTNIYTGPTLVSNGTLLVNGSLSTNTVTVNGGTLGGNGTIGGSVTVAAAGSLAPGVSAGTLAIGGGLDLAAPAAGTGKLNFELDALAGASDKIAVAGMLTIGAGVLGFSDFVFTNLGGLQAGTYKLITSGGISGTLDGADLSGAIGAFTGTLHITGNDLELVVSSGTLTPPVFSRVGPLSGGSFSLTFNGMSGQGYLLLTSTNVALPLSNWTVLAIGTFSNSPVTYTDTNATNAQQFYCLKPLALLQDDFERGAAGWTTGSDGAAGTAWELGTPQNVGPTAAHSGTNCFGSNIADNYALDANIWLRSPAIDLTTAPRATLEFWQFIALWGQGTDFGTVRLLEASTGSVLAVLATPVEGFSGGWVLFQQALPAVAYGKQVKLEFRLEGVFGGLAGWYLDDVKVTIP